MPKRRTSGRSAAASLRAAGGELDDWLQAEAEIDRMIKQGGTRSRHALQHL